MAFITKNFRSGIQTFFPKVNETFQRLTSETTVAQKRIGKASSSDMGKSTKEMQKKKKTPKNSKSGIFYKILRITNSGTAG